MNATKITLRNDFHQNSTDAFLPASGVLSARQMRQIKSALCDIPECRCGCIRGPQTGPNGERMELTQISQDGATRVDLIAEEAWS